MTSNKTSFRLILAVACLALISSVAYAGTYSGAYDSLFIKSDAQARGMGEAVTALDGTSASMSYNPAGLGSIPGKLFSVSSYFGLVGTGTVDLNAVLPFSFGTLGIGLAYFGIPEDTFLDSSGNSLQKINNSDVVINLGYGKELNNGLMFGAAMKILSQNHVSVASGGFGLDAGVIYKLKALPEKSGALTFGLTLKDLLIMENLNFGIRYKLPGIPLSFENDVSYYFYGQAFDKIGAEFMIADMFSIRAGYKIGYDLGALSLGVGFTKSLMAGGPVISINYAFNPDAEATLGQMHSFDIQILLPTGGVKKIMPEKKAEIKKEETPKVIPQTTGTLPVITIMNFKNISKIEKLDPLMKLIPTKTIELLNTQNAADIKTRNIDEFGEKPDATKMGAAGITYIVAGAYDRKESKIIVQYMLIDPLSMEKFGKDSFEVDIKKGMDDAAAQELAARILKAIKDKAAAPK